MKCLAYCIYQNEGSGSADGLLGVDGRPVRQIKRDNLVAAVSCIDLPENSLSIETITRYHKVIDFLYQHRTVIPLRFGTAFDTEIEVEHLLETRRGRYTKLLEELHGQVEMGIRVMVESRNRSGETLPRSAREPSPNPINPGESYLASRKSHYAMESVLVEENEIAINRYSAPFKTMCSKIKSEVSTAGPNHKGASRPILLSLYFLVPRQALDGFREAFEHMRSRESIKMLLSGPWPPYNFVLPSDLPAQGSSLT
jgi:hypothetical protein